MDHLERDSTPESQPPLSQRSHPSGRKAPNHGHRILVVDDDDATRRALAKMLQALGLETEEASDGLECLAKLALDVDLVITDANMPNMDGFQVTERIRQDHLDLPIVMVTGLDSSEDRLRAVQAGVNDFLTKPFDFTELQLRVGWLLRMKEATDALQVERAELEKTVGRRTAELRRALDESVRAQREAHSAHLDTIRRLVLAAEYKDRDTAGHIERIGAYSAALGRALGMGPTQVEVLRHASQMHDVGKMGIPDSILLKPGPLDDEEWVVMKSHTVLGARILDGSPSELLQVGRVIALAHHEKWDGTGYPTGLSGVDIPMEGRICAVADFFDALSTNRPYRAALPHDTVYAMMEERRGTHLDPDVLDIFFEIRDEVEAIQREWSAKGGGDGDKLEPLSHGGPDA